MQSSPAYMYTCNICCRKFCLMAYSLIIEIQKLLNNGQIGEDYVEKLLNVQYPCHMIEQGQECD